MIRQLSSLVLLSYLSLTSSQGYQSNPMFCMDYYPHENRLLINCTAIEEPHHQLLAVAISKSHRSFYFYDNDTRSNPAIIYDPSSGVSKIINIAPGIFYIDEVSEETTGRYTCQYTYWDHTPGAPASARTPVNGGYFNHPGLATTVNPSEGDSCRVLTEATTPAPGSDPGGSAAVAPISWSLILLLSLKLFTNLNCLD